RVERVNFMRSVAYEMGQKSGYGAHLASLRRTALCEFDLAEAHTLDEVDSAAKAQQLEDVFVHPRKLLPQFPSVTANDEMAARIRSGRTVNLPELSRAKQVKVFYGKRELIAIANRVAGTLSHTKLVLATTEPH